MNTNKSLSARIRRRNKYGFDGVGTGLGFNPANKKWGDYTNSKQNHKNIDRLNDNRHKNKVAYRKMILSNGFPVIINQNAMTKKFADNHQKVTK